MSSPEPPPIARHLPPRLARLGSAALALGLLAAGIWVLQRELLRLSPGQLRAAVAGLPPDRLLGAALCALGAYLSLACLDWLALLHLGQRLPPVRTTVAAMTGFALSNSVGWNVVAGASVRYRFYSRWGLSGLHLAGLVSSNVVGFWLAMGGLGGATLLTADRPGLGLVPDALARTVGALALGSALAYLALGLVGLRSAGPLTLRLGARRFRLPPPPWVLGQLLLSSLHWALAAALLHLLLPAELGLSYPALAGRFLAAQLLGVVSQVPAGLGVFEASLLGLLAGRAPAETLLPGLLLYRAFYYLLPLLAGLTVLAVDALRRRG